MAIDLADYERKAREAIQAFWDNREKAHQKQIESGKADQGERASVTAGKNMDGFISLVLFATKVVTFRSPLLAPVRFVSSTDSFASCVGNIVASY